MITLALCGVAIGLGAFAGMFCATAETELGEACALAMVFAIVSAIVLAII